MSINYELIENERLIENAFADPYVTEIFSDIRDYNELLRTTDAVDKSELEAIISELDERWLPIACQPAHISGLMTYMKPGSEHGFDASPELEKKYYSESPVWTEGFVIDTQPVIIGGEILGMDYYKIVLQVVRDADVDSTDESAGTYRGIADIDEISISLATMSPQHAEAYISYFHASVAEEIDQIVLNGNSNEAEATMAFKDFTVELKDDGQTTNSEMALSIYLNSLLEYDRDVPYECVLSGDCMVIKEAEDLIVEASIEESNWLVGVNHIILRTRGDSNIYEPCLNMHLFSHDRTKDSVQIIIPLRNVSEFESIRGVFYSD